MKSYLVLLSEKQPQLSSDHLLKAHMDFLKQLRANDQLLLCGPFADNKGAVLIINAESKIHAEEMINQDPFIQQKYYKQFVVHEFIAASDDNNWLADKKTT